jgi:hypothetical protein
LLDGEPREIAQLHQLGGLGIVFSEQVQRLVQGKKIVGWSRGSNFDRVKIEAHVVSATFGSVPSAGIVNQDSPYRLGCGSERG